MAVISLATLNIYINIYFSYNENECKLDDFLLSGGDFRYKQFTDLFGLLEDILLKDFN